MEKSMAPLNGVVEPDFLEYLTKNFKRWQQLAVQGVPLGSREIAKFQNILMGAKLNARFGFEAITRRDVSEQDRAEHYTVFIYRNREAAETEEPLYIFDTPICR